MKFYQNTRTSAIGLIQNSYEMSYAYTLLEEKHFGPVILEGIKLNLLCSSIELSAKGFLKHNHYNIEQLRKEFRHDIYKLLCELNKTYNFQIGNNDLMLIKKITPFYKDRKYMYYEYGYKPFGYYLEVADIAKDLLDNCIKGWK